MAPVHRLAWSPRIAGAARRRYHAGIRAARWSAAVGLVFSVAKITAGVLGGSRAALADGIETACDTVTSMILLGGLGVSRRPPDLDHPYGHERAESVTAVLLSAILVCAGVAAGWSALAGAPADRPPSLWTVWPVLLALPVKALLAAWKTRLGERDDSTSLRSEGFNDAADVLSGVIAAGGILLARSPGWLAADRAAALLVAGLILAGGARLLRRSLSELMDEAPPAAMRRAIHRIALGTPGVIRVDKCLGRRSGTGYWLDLHLEVDAGIRLRDAHAIGHAVKARVLAALPAVRDVLTHLEPAVRRRAP